jgi:hypothetical protein
LTLDHWPVARSCSNIEMQRKPLLDCARLPAICRRCDGCHLTIFFPVTWFCHSMTRQRSTATVSLSPVSYQNENLVVRPRPRRPNLTSAMIPRSHVGFIAFYEVILLRNHAESLLGHSDGRILSLEVVLRNRVGSRLRHSCALACA